MNWYGFLGPGVNRRGDQWTIWRSLWIHMSLERLWNTMNPYGGLVPELDRRWSLWAISNPFETIWCLNGSEAVWVYVAVGAREYIKDGCCELSDILEFRWLVKDPWNNMTWHRCLGPDIKSKMVRPVNYKYMNNYCGLCQHIRLHVKICVSIHWDKKHTWHDAEIKILITLT